MYILHTTTKSKTIPLKFTGIIECSDGYKEWHVDGKLHRLDGPAREWTDGTKDWYVDGKQVTESEHKELVNKLNKPTCSMNEKIVEIDGQRYKMILVD